MSRHIYLLESRLPHFLTTLRNMKQGNRNELCWWLFLPALKSPLRTELHCLAEPNQLFLLIFTRFTGQKGQRFSCNFYQKIFSVRFSLQFSHEIKGWQWILLAKAVHTHPAGELAECDVVLSILFQQVKGSLCHCICVWSTLPRHQQLVKALKLGSVYLVMFRRGRIHSVAPVQVNEMLRL